MTETAQNDLKDELTIENSESKFIKGFLLTLAATITEIKEETEKTPSSQSLAQAQITFKLGGKDCKLFSDEEFVKIRNRLKIDLNFSPDTSKLDFADLKSGGGKGGGKMVFSKDKQFIFKEIDGDDDSTLIKITKELVKHISGSSSTLLVPIFCHFEVELGRHKEKSRFFGMINGLWRPIETNFLKIYDLKGCADDKLLLEKGSKVKTVHKRFYDIKFILPFFNYIFRKKTFKERKIYFDGKLEALHSPYIPLSQIQKNIFIEVLRRDLMFLTKHNLMDYSLLVGVKESHHGIHPGVVEAEIHEEKTDIEKSEKVLKTFDALGNQMIENIRARDFIFTKSRSTKEGKEVTFALIDYLQEWNAKKKVAKCIKSFERNKATVPPKVYARRMIDHFEHFIIPVDVDEVKRTKSEVDKNVADQLMGFRCFPFKRR